MLVRAASRVIVREVLMRDYDMTELVAKKLLKYHTVQMVEYEPFAKGWGAWVGLENGYKRNFNPISSDNDCMEVWDEFSKEFEKMSNSDIRRVMDELGVVMVNAIGDERRRGILRIVTSRIGG